MKTLIIDDDAINNFLCKKVMELSGYSKDIHSCLSVDEGLQYLKELVSEGANEFPETLFLDINMPVRNGWDFLTDYKALLDQGAVKPLKIYMLSSSVYEDDIAKAKENSLVSEYVIKPLDANTLANLK